MKRETTAAIAAAFGAAVLLAAGAGAAEPSLGPCRADVEKFCPGTPIGAGRIFACLQLHATELSPACKTHIDSRQEHRKQHGVSDNPNRAWVSECSGDIQKLCADIPAGRGRVAQCLNEHQSSISAGCKKALNNRKTPSTTAK